MSLAGKIFNVVHYVANKVQRPAVILLYHRVTDLEQDPQELAVSPANYDAQLGHLAAEYSVLDAARFMYHVKHKKPFPERSVFITFDDGYADNYHEALPVHAKHELPGLFYITTSKLGTSQELWWDDLERILLATDPLPLALKVNINGQAWEYPTDSFAAARKTYFALQQVLRFSTPDVIDAVMAQLHDWAGVTAEGRSSHRLMTWEELKVMSQSPYVTIGCHTHRHPAVGVLSYDEQYKEIATSKTLLEQHLHLPIDHFSYPFGSRKFLGAKRYYNADSIKAAKALDLKMVCANYHGQVHTWSNPYALPRILVRDWELPVFKNKMEQFFKY
ncbi:Polysaccharide deacetylase [Chitinophaga terrae (ex Kim and Jung 2007)]|uniref:Polysaccharide deacetylase n=1 Tax=Chitinophaga terrae (ex Kim and Jung 2007) TaxID=408074 RepID=A0A1H4AJD5_9BACT|nr:polysaccharide deacetylase family protein [Chitinophaga terrae (ex Kim and Jung 2007)]GEP89314.1 polysaccharide deacetylase [Chitinophaga terrae (ex Kim and Jung 2007)]SEA35764.1 Polysaccharide deacetylase [Chitinophaga terrae (ex Kim and Jung 2007)]